MFWLLKNLLKVSTELYSRWGSDASLAETRMKAIISVYSHEVCVYSDL